MTKFKDFGAGISAPESEPISFKLFDQEFHCVPALQGKVLLGFVADSSSADPAVQANIITKFFDFVLTDESLAAFNELQLDKEKIVSIDTLGEILSWVVEQYTDRPN